MNDNNNITYYLILMTFVVLSVLMTIFLVKLADKHYKNQKQ